MFREMAEAGQPAPEYRQNEFMVYATIRQHGDEVTTEKTTEKTTERDVGVNGELNGQLSGQLNETLSETLSETLNLVRNNPGIKRIDLVDRTGLAPATISRYISVLIEKNLIERRGSKKTGGYYPVGTK